MRLLKGNYENNGIFNKNPNFKRKYTFALVSDLHGEACEEVLKALFDISPDYILAAGDIFEPLLRSNSMINESGYKLLSEAAKIAPTVYSPGNHEIGGTRSWSPKWRFAKGKKKTYHKECLARVKASGAVFLDDEQTVIDGIRFGGLCSGIVADDMKPNLRFIKEFCRGDGPKVLLCHHPEYYKKYLKGKDIDLIVSGHAHGGQWRFFGRGVFAPGQGLFPKYTAGVHDNKLVISRGLKNNSTVPRIFNPPEVIKIIINP